MRGIFFTRGGGHAGRIAIQHLCGKQIAIDVAVLDQVYVDDHGDGINLSRV